MKTAVVNRIINEKGETLILLRAKKPFGWCLAGGKIDKGESPIQACIRETKEETGVSVIDPTYHNFLGEFKGNEISIDGTNVHIFETVLDHTPEVVISKREHLNYRWIKTHYNEYKGTYTSEMRDLKFAGNTLNFLDCGREIFVPEF